MRGRTSPGLGPGAILLVGLSLSIGWGVRGNWGHEYGAMIPGALAALAACLLSGREDWRRRAPFFAFFGALGWSFGGSISYMQVIAYTHSGHAPSQLYGYLCLFVIGFLWGSIGGAGTAAPACLERERLVEFFPPLLAIFAAWAAQNSVLVAICHRSLGWSYQRIWVDLFWYDTDWVAALAAIPAILIQSAIRRRWTAADSLLFQMALGWWIGFLVLTNSLGLRMTPPRGDNWAGVLGMAAALGIFLLRHRLIPLFLAWLVSGMIGGFGFAWAQLLKLAEMKYFLVDRGYSANYHSILEQSYGFLNGVGIAAAMGLLASRLPRLEEGEPEEGPNRCAEAFCVGFVLIFITHANIVKNVIYAWVPARVVPAAIYGLPALAWFNMAYAILGGTILLLIFRNFRRPLAILPASALGQGQLFYLLFLWWIVLANASRVFPFDPQRLATEGTIHVNACLCTWLILALPREGEPPLRSEPNWPRLAWIALALGLALLAASTAIEQAATRRLYGDAPAPNANLHIRFGPNATIYEQVPRRKSKPPPAASQAKPAPAAR